ncbi:MAG: GNAT family N-acetyltransferase [Planctomycetes bacterium]|nr:GNAT family N-acetyltransferase [Planctomycetota bacterium]
MVESDATRREVTTSDSDLSLLRRFYDSVYVREFPDQNERESLENMEKYLRLKEEGWYERNNYHILLFLDGGSPIAGAIIDYLAGPNAGVIEFLVVAENARGRGWGRRLLSWVEEALAADARRAGSAGWDYLIGEMNDPFRSSPSTDSMDPFVRAAIWDGWGFEKVRFPYVQPSLSAEKQPVRNLLLMCKPGEGRDRSAIPAKTLREVVYGYAKWAMRIDDPEANPECREMFGYLEGRDRIDLWALACYVGAPEGRRLVYTDLDRIPIEEIDALLDIYSSVFAEGPTSVPREAFRRSLLTRRHEARPYAYHFLSIKADPAGPPHGMVSFFTFPGAGFGGYVVLDAALRRKGHLREVIAVMERMMVIDRREAAGWWAECDEKDGSLPAFRRRGFHEADLEYRQPPLRGMPHYSIDEAPVLHLVYKAFGETFERPRMAWEDLLRALRWILRVIYDMDAPERSDYYRHVAAQAGGRRDLDWK